MTPPPQTKQPLSYVNKNAGNNPFLPDNTEGYSSFDGRVHRALSEMGHSFGTILRSSWPKLNFSIYD
jgi:hypothetical protein